MCAPVEGFAAPFSAKIGDFDGAALCTPAKKSQDLRKLLGQGLGDVLAFRQKNKPSKSAERRLLRTFGAGMTAILNIEGEYPIREVLEGLYTLLDQLTLASSRKSRSSTV